MPLDLPARVAAAFERWNVAGPVVLAVSGGADSVALLRAAVAMPNTLRFVVAHLDHGLRAGAAADAAWVAEQAAGLGLPCVVGRARLGGTVGGVEEAARTARYEFLKRTAAEHAAAFVATAHTTDDQAETVLFHVLRGTGLAGLCGIPRRRKLAAGVTLLRPLLDVSRAEIEAYLTALGQPFLTDPTNADRAFRRNRLRHGLLPPLREEFNPRVDDALRRLAQQASDAHRLIRRQARRELRAATVESSPQVIRLRRERLARLPPPLVREALSLAWKRAGWPRQAMSFAHWSALASLVRSGGRRTLPGGADARVRRGEIVIARPS